MSNSLSYIFVKFFDRLFKKRHRLINNFFAKKGVTFYGDGRPPRIFSDISLSEPWLITIGCDTTISSNVSFVTHDNSVSKITKFTDIFGEIRIGKNCFIGQNSTILYGVSICDNVIVAAGSVVTKSIKQKGVIVAGNPARIVSTWDNLQKKASLYGYDLKSIGLKELERKHKEGLLKLIEK